MATLKITGKIAISQFWPEGKSDADTTNLKMKVDGFQFKTNGPFKPTAAYINTEISVQGKKKSIISYEGQARQHINVRLQGIDAPELHYRIYAPSEIGKYKSNAVFKELNKHEYRQFMSENATVALGNHLKPFADVNGEVACYFISENLNEPKDVLDVYGRFVGDIVISQNNQNININQWLLQENWVLPAYYNSMLPNEITTLETIYQQSIVKQRISKQYTNKINAASFDFNLRFREPNINPVVNSQADTGKVIFPKMFRRLCPYWIKKKAGIENITFEKYLKNSDSSDGLHFRSNFLQNGNAATKLTLSKIYANDKLDYQGTEVKPNDIVFIEKDNPNAKLLKKDSQTVVNGF
jgi:endonuclease YncB( thermonuclease family)